MATLHLALWATALSREDLSNAVVHAAVCSFYNWAGCAIGGSNELATRIAYDSLSPFCGAETSCLLGYQGRLRTDAQLAALINGIASHAHDYDDTHPRSLIHPSAPVCSALLAYSGWKRPVSGPDFLVALVAGIEAECKVGLAVTPAHYDKGWHITSTAGSIGAAVAVGKLMRLDVPAMQHAIGIAATQVTGLREMFGSHTKPFHPGRAAQNGLLSAVLASGGYTSSLKALEAERGWANVVSTSDQLLYQINSLGETWEILQNTFKPFPCGLVNHPIIDACIRLHQELVKVGVEISEIVSISAKVHPLVLELTGNRNPKDGLQAKFSVFHSGSISLALGKAGLAQYLDLAVQDPVIIEVRDKMDAVADETITPDEAIVILVLRDGRQFKKHITHAVGCVEVPMTDGQLEEKFKDQTLLVYKDPKMVDRASESCWAIESANDVAAVAELL